MPSQNYIILFFFLLCSAIYTGCGRNPAPLYDSKKGELLLEAGEAMIAGQNKTVLTSLKKIEELEEGRDDFSEEALLAVQRMEHFKIVNNCLARKDYQALNDFITSKIYTGEASPELMEIKDLPAALQALNVFCSKIPWESSQALKKGLDDLDLHKDVLDIAPSFRKFHAEQFALMEKLQKKEIKARRRELLEIMEISAAILDSAAYNDAKNTLRLEQPDDNFFKLEKLLKTEDINEPVDSLELQLLLAVHWHKLPPKRRKILLNKIKNNAGICLLLINIFDKNTLVTYEAYFQECKTRNLGVPGRMVKRYLDLLPLSNSKFSAWIWRSPCPGVLDTALKLQQAKSEK